MRVLVRKSAMTKDSGPKMPHEIDKYLVRYAARVHNRRMGATFQRVAFHYSALATHGRKPRRRQRDGPFQNAATVTHRRQQEQPPEDDGPTGIRRNARIGNRRR